MASSQSPLAGRREALAALAADLRRIFGVRLKALVAYGMSPAADDLLPTLALVDGLVFADLAACAPVTGSWKRGGLAVPLIITVEEFRRTLDVFPLEYDSILSDHVVIEGAPRFEGLRVPEADIRRACELQAKSHLIHLREGFLEGSREPRAVAGLIASSAAAFRTLLVNIARLHGGADRVRLSSSDEAIAAAAERTIGIRSDTVRDVLASPRAGSAAVDPTALLTRYLEAAERIWNHVDNWSRT